MLEYLSLDIICSSKLTIFLELHSRKTDNVRGQYRNIISRQMEAFVFIILRNTCSFETGEYHLDIPQF